ncbi:transmembrane protein 44 isoform X2 [Xyrauchen texanus]|uniref:transmembrane protein 44 isoform X2 n=1 Tax=Xyrauchen texanus TaxID=154827 RepID=UPI002241E665|nr:transmembrane protein 44 isoform X2 [Xyrauchen texanus]
MTVLDTVHRWSSELVKVCLSSYEDNICISAALILSSALMLLVSCSLCSTRGGHHQGEEAAGTVYCFVGNLCSAVGAFLSNQFDFQISMASYAAILDVVQFLTITFSVYLWSHSKTGKRMRMITGRRRQNFLAVSLLFVTGGSFYLRSAVDFSPTGISPTRRRLLGVFLNDHIENLGYVLGLLSFAINWTAKFPFFLKANQGEQSSVAQVCSRVLCCLAGTLYGSAILLYDVQPRVLIKAMPWILSAVCCAVLDLAIVVLVCYRSSHKRLSVRSLDSDTESLLADSSATGQLCDSTVTRCIKEHRLPSAKCICPRGTDMGLYMDVNIQPMRKVCLKEVTISRDGPSETLPLKRTVRVVRVDEQCSSGSLTESSSVGSELEWDFEATKAQWTPAPEDLQTVQSVPLQDWRVSSGSKSTSSRGSHICLCNRAPLSEKMPFK